MKQYEVIVTGRFWEIFPAEDEEAARKEIMRQIPGDFSVDDVEIIEL